MYPNDPNHSRIQAYRYIFLFLFHYYLRDEKVNRLIALPKFYLGVKTQIHGRGTF